MKIKVDLYTGKFSYEREPMPKNRFKAVCCVLCLLLYIGLVSVAGVLTGIDGAIISALFGVVVCGAAIFTIAEIGDNE